MLYSQYCRQNVEKKTDRETDKATSHHNYYMVRKVRKPRNPEIDRIIFIGVQIVYKLVVALLVLCTVR